MNPQHIHQYIQNFASLLFQETNATLRYRIDGNELWICAKDLAEPLNKTEDAIRMQLQQIPSDWKGVKSVYTPGGEQKLTFITSNQGYFDNNITEKPNTK